MKSSRMERNPLNTSPSSTHVGCLTAWVSGLGFDLLSELRGDLADLSDEVSCLAAGGV